MGDNVSYTPTREDLIQDFRRLASDYSKVTRDLYRDKGNYSETSWRKVFPKFSDFVLAVYAQPNGEANQQTLSTDSQTFFGDKWDISLPKTRIHTLDELVEYCQVDLSIWRVDKLVINKWEVGAKNANGDLVVEPLFQVKATLSKKQEVIAAKNEIEELKREATEFIFRPHLKLARSDKYSGNSLELLIPDLHAGKFAWSKETGYPDYDTPTAIATYERAVETILDRAAGYKFDEILLGIGNDALNSDDYNSQTTKGTLVSSDTRYPKTYKAVRQMYVRTIEKLRKIAPVKVKVIPGNHDTVTTFTLGDSLECWFHNDPEVEIDNGPSPHKFYTWGRVLLGFCHGDKGKKADYGLWMATERPVDFGNSTFREIHIGHTHGLKVDEKFGVRVRTFAALCPPDAWHSAEHFVGNLRQAEAIVWNKEAGRIAEFIHTELD
jgi:hypothetical protein